MRTQPVLSSPWRLQTLTDRLALRAFLKSFAIFHVRTLRLGRDNVPMPSCLEAGQWDFPYLSDREHVRDQRCGALCQRPVKNGSECSSPGLCSLPRPWVQFCPCPWLSGNPCGIALTISHCEYTLNKYLLSNCKRPAQAVTTQIKVSPGALPSDCKPHTSRDTPAFLPRLSLLKGRDTVTGRGVKSQ